MKGRLAIRSVASRGTVASAIFPRRRVLTGPALRGADPLAVASESQRRLIALTA